MKIITIQVSDKIHHLFMKNKSKVEEIVEKTLAEQADEIAVDRLEYVRVICRAKAPVCNWHDMELDIMKGSL